MLYFFILCDMILQWQLTFSKKEGGRKGDVMFSFIFSQLRVQCFETVLIAEHEIQGARLDPHPTLYT